MEIELIVVDDGSSDDSASQARKAGAGNITLIQSGGRGVASAFNLGLKQVTGKYVARCDADDLYVRGRLRQQVTWLDAHPEFGAICGGFATMTVNGSFIRDMHCGANAEEITSELVIGDTRTSFCTWLTRTSLVQMAGGCREYFRLAEDIDLQLRLCELGRVWFEPGRSYMYRLHDASATHSNHSELRLFYDTEARRFAEQRRTIGMDDLERGTAPAPPSVSRRVSNGSRQHVQDLLLGVAWDKLFAGHPVRAVRTGLRACLIQPMNVDAWKNLGAMVIRGQRN